MPTYEYKCKECEHSFEAFQSMRDDPLSICPECGGPVRRVLSGGAGVIFKGEGFYVTDKGKTSAGGASAEVSERDAVAKKDVTSTASSNTDAATPCSTCRAAAAGTPCAARANHVT
jgi:putative FmdB family regulatory protein